MLRDLDDGLILRRATPEDVAALAVFNAQIHRDDPDGDPADRIGIWTRDLFERPPPTFDVSDFTIVEDAGSGDIVSSANLISQTWSYDGTEFGVGRPELVGTLPEYRRRGLVRAQFEVIHEWSAERGEVMQAITGIPWFYRLFGYDMALTLGGGRAGYAPHVPRLDEDKEDPYHVRPAGKNDLGFIAELYASGAQRWRIACVRDEELWAYELEGKSERNVNRHELRIVETPSGESVGFIAHPPWNWGNLLAAIAYELKPNVSWVAVTPSVVRYLWETGQQYAKNNADGSRFGSFGFWLGAEHPVYRVMAAGLPRQQDPYAWYIRVPDVVSFVRLVAPALERRLKGSVAAGHTGELRISFYRNGLKLALEGGAVTTVEPWSPDTATEGDAAFPDLTFLQLLLGFRSLEELEHAYADCWVDNDGARAVVDSLFPPQPSDVWPVA